MGQSNMLIMKPHQWIFSAIVSSSLILAGCSKQSTVDTAPLEASFKSAEPATQSSVDKAVAAVKSADYSGALTQLQTLAKNAKLTPEQQQAIKDVMAQVQKAITDAAGKAVGEASKSLDDMKKSLPK
jgi:uncharacterized lipoprotein YajG